MKTFVPFNKIGQENVVVVVDALHPRHLTLSHWKGANNIETIAADTSGEIVLNAIEQKLEGIDCHFVTATHFDIDGFVGVFALFYPKLALAYKKVLVAMATIGDFREFNPSLIEHHTALKLCCWMNKVESVQFYRPFEATDEIERCVQKFDYFLPLFPDVLENIEKYKADWEEEFNRVINGVSQIQERQPFSAIGLLSQKVNAPIHYYSLFHQTKEWDIILSIYPENRYELEYKYLTWVDIVSRTTFPRVNLQPLVQLLNEIESSHFFWRADHITDTGPILRLEKNELSKAERYAHPFERDIYSSSINSEKFQSILVQYFQECYQNVLPKKHWTWQEMKAF